MRALASMTQERAQARKRNESDLQKPDTLTLDGSIHITGT